MDIVVNKKAYFNYTIEAEYEAGLILTGWEVKSIRAKRINITDAHVLLRHGEAFLLGARIDPLSTASTHVDAQPDRTRQLLLHRTELSKLIGSVERAGYTLIPLALYWKHNRIKLKLALAKGKRQYDKRQQVKERDWHRQQQRMMKR